MTEQEYDFVVIGGGSAGYAAARQATDLGLKTAVVEGGEKVGGLCILRGCMPSKTYLESGHRAEAIRRAGEFGLKATYAGADGAAIQARKRALVADFAGYRQEQLEQGAFDFVRGQARFVSPHAVKVGRREGGSVLLRAKTFLLATGSRIKWYSIPGLQEVGCLDSDAVLELEHIPRSLIVLGGGPTALEFASHYAGLGSRVTVIQRGPQLLRGMDADVGEALAEALRARGLEVHTGTEILRVEKGEHGKRVLFRCHGGECAVEAEEIIYSLGRTPNTEGLHLQDAGVPVEKWGGVHAECNRATRQAHIFAAGDVCGPYEVVHIAIQQGEVAARNAARLVRGETGSQVEMDYSLKLLAVFTQPSVAMVGLSAREATELGCPFLEAKYPFADHGKAMVEGETHGFVKLLCSVPERKIIGGAVVGPEAAEIIHEVVVAMRFGATAAQFAAVPHYHPTLSEIWTYPAEALAGAQMDGGE